MKEAAFKRFALQRTENEAWQAGGRSCGGLQYNCRLGLIKET